MGGELSECWGPLGLQRLTVGSRGVYAPLIPFKPIRGGEVSKRDYNTLQYVNENELTWYHEHGYLLHHHVEYSTNGDWITDQWYAATPEWLELYHNWTGLGPFTDKPPAKRLSFQVSQR